MPANHCILLLHSVIQLLSRSRKQVQGNLFFLCRTEGQEEGRKSIPINFVVFAVAKKFIQEFWIERLGFWGSGEIDVENRARVGNLGVF